MFEKDSVKAMWDAATRRGHPDSTTSYHKQHDKQKYEYDAAGNQIGERPRSLGFLKFSRFVQWVVRREGLESLGLRLESPGRSAAHETHARAVISALWELMVRCSAEHEIVAGDYAAIGRVRSLRAGSYVTFTGFLSALASEEFERARGAWVWAPPPPSPPPPPPSPPSPPPSPRLRDVLEAWRDALRTSECEFGACGTRVCVATSHYRLIAKRPRRGDACRAVRATLLLARGRRGARTALTSEAQLSAHFC